MKNWILRRKAYLLVSLCCFAAVLLLHPFFLPWMSEFLVFERLTPHADVAVVLAGGYGEREEKAAALYRQGVVSTLLVSGGPVVLGIPYADLMKRYLVRLGVPTENILCEAKSESTYDNAVFTKTIIQQHRYKRILLVTSRFHSRRSFSIFQKVYKGLPVHLYMIAANDNVDAYRWWHSHEMADKVLTEWAKTLIYWINY